MGSNMSNMSNMGMGMQFPQQTTNNQHKPQQSTNMGMGDFNSSKSIDYDPFSTLSYSGSGNTIQMNTFSMEPQKTQSNNNNFSLDMGIGMGNTGNTNFNRGGGMDLGLGNMNTSKGNQNTGFNNMQ